MARGTVQDYNAKKRAHEDRARASTRRIRQGEPGYGEKKFVATGEHQGKPYTVRFGDAKMEIKRDDPKKRANFRSRHGCDNPGPPNKAKYHSCRMWSGKAVSDLAK